MLERRRQPRPLTLKTGTIRFPGDGKAVHCAIFDLSGGGACLIVPTGADIPATFDLTIDPDRASRVCRVRWKSGNKIGVAFQTPFRT
jgi:hypothetical protein